MIEKRWEEGVEEEDVMNTHANFIQESDELNSNAKSHLSLLKGGPL